MVASQERPFLEIGDLDVAGVFDGYEHIVHRTAYARDAFEDESRIGSVGTVTEIARALDFAVMYVIADALHER